MSSNGINKNIDEQVLIDGKKYRFQGTVDFTNLTIERIDDDDGNIPDPEPNPNPGPTDVTKPTEGFIKKGGWGADLTNKNMWKVVNMRDHPEQFKVVDGAGKNIATNFTSQQIAENFIAYFKTHEFPPKDTKPDPEPNPTPKPDPTPTPAGKGLDKYGVKLLVADGSEISYEYEKDTRPGKNDGIRYNMKNVGKWKGSEVTGYFMFTQNPVDDEVSIKWSEKSHSGKNEVQCYDSGIEIKTGKSRMRFENPHPEYSNNLGGGQGYPLKDKWIGYKGIWIPNADDSVTVTLYQDIGDNEGDKPANDWKEVYKYTDTKYKRSGPHPEITLRVDDPAKKGQKNLREKWLSAAAIK